MGLSENKVHLFSCIRNGVYL